MQNISLARPGRRRLTEGHLIARRRAEALDRAALPPRPAVKTAVMRVGRLLSWPSWVGPTLHALIEFCASWDDGELVVFPQNARLVHELGIGRRAVSARLFRLAELGLIAFRDRPGMRRGRDESGQAFGIDLAPLAHLYPEWSAALRLDASGYARLRAATRDLRRAVRDLDDLVLFAESRSVAMEPFLSRRDAVALRAARVAASGMLEEISRLTAETDTLRREIEAALLPLTSSPDGPADAVGDPCASRGAHRPGALTTAEVESTAPPEAGTGFLDSKPGPSSPLQPADLRARGSIEASREEIGVAQILALAPELAETLGSSDPSPSDLLEAARWHAQSIGFAQRDWGDGCVAIGRQRMTLALALVLHACRTRTVASPGGLLAWFVRHETERPGTLSAAMRSRLDPGRSGRRMESQSKSHFICIRT